MRFITLLLVVFLVGASDCDPQPPPPPPPPADPYCQGAGQPVGFVTSIIDGVAGIWNTIIGGTPSTDRRATAFVQIGSSGYCSGTVLSAHTVLTAAHCDGSPMRARIDGQTFTASDKLLHPGYVAGAIATESEPARAPFNDLMLLYFEGNTLPEPYVSDIYDVDRHSECDSLIAQGWGKSETPAIDLNESFYTVKNIYSLTLSTKQATPGGICFGDSGGPLYAVLGGDLAIAGVTSTTYSQDCLIGGDHVRTSAFKDWIEDNIR